MKTILIPVAGNSLVSGVVWHPFASKSPNSELRKRAATSSIKTYALLGKKSGVGNYYGLIKKTGLKRKNVFALASVLYKSVPSGAAAVILKHDSYYSACCINNGTPVLDQVFTNQTDAINEIELISQNLNVKPRVNFENSRGLHFVERLEVKLLGAKKLRAKPLQEVPASPVGFLALSCLLVGAGCWYVYAQKAEAERVEAARQKSIRDADPVPKYMKQRMLQEGTVALKTSAIHDMLTKLIPLKVDPVGWNFVHAKCQVGEPSECSVAYRRTDGTYKDLENVLSGFEIKYAAPTDLNNAVAYAEFNSEGFVLPETNHSYSEFIKTKFGNRGQDWLTAGIGLSMTAPALWPQVAGVPNTFRHPMAVQIGKMNISNIPLYLFEDLLATKPENVHIKSFEIKTLSSEKTIELYVNADAIYQVNQD